MIGRLASEDLVFFVCWLILATAGYTVMVGWRP